MALIDVLTADAWAITQEGLAQIIAIAERRNEATPEALEAYRAHHVPQSERLEMRDGVAIVHATGPLFRYANLFTAISGATSYDVMRTDFQVALDDPDAKAILLSFDTPGGHVNGVNEMAKAIRDARGVKPVVAYVGGMAASAGYWLASQADRIVIDETAILGSIGVRAAFPAQGDDGSVEFISSQSPGKRLDLASDDGRARIQSRVDALADVFVEAVAAGRGVSAQHVIQRFGAGDVLVGKAAVAAGMADEIGTFEGVIASLSPADNPAAARQEAADRPLFFDRAAPRAKAALPPIDAADAAWLSMTTQGVEATIRAAHTRAQAPTYGASPVTSNATPYVPGHLTNAQADEIWAKALAQTTERLDGIDQPTAPHAAPPQPVQAPASGNALVLAVGGHEPPKAEDQVDATWKAAIAETNARRGF